MAGTVELSPFARMLFQVRRTTLEMLHDRGYIVDTEERTKTEETFAGEFKAENYRGVSGYMVAFSARKVVPAGEGEGEGDGDGDGDSDGNNEAPPPQWETIAVFHHLVKFGVKDLRKYMTYAHQSSINKVILIYANVPSPYARSAIRDFNNKDGACLHIEEFSEKRVSFNVTHHELVPVHTKLSEAGKQVLLKKYGTGEDKLPRIVSSDPVARYLGLAPGDVVRIVRRSETAGRCATYRLVHAENLETRQL